MSDDKREMVDEQDDGTVKESRRDFLKKIGLAAAATATTPAAAAKAVSIAEALQGHFELMSDEQKQEAIARLEERYSEQFGKQVTVDNTPAPDGVLFGYALNISKCIGCRRCVEACVRENNQSRDPAIQWIRVLRMEKGKLAFDPKDLNAGSPSSSPLGDHGIQSGGHAHKYIGLSGTNEHYYNPEQVPEDNAFYFPVQCQQCEKPACVKACPVRATYRDPNGIVVIDYNWCIGCRMCQLACPYWARRFNWGEPVLPSEDMNPKTHYLGNRPRPRGVMEKCTFCLQRVRDGRYPACVEACPVGARKFGNLLDPESEVRKVLATKQVFRFKEEFSTYPKFFYYMD
ncbi:MAG: 4Fe-4S dicluster domain-containing protein [Candidatus Electronema sp. V4]|uniref:4Fe-4S dicluster domain-containing protein n=1 Tax=Candidatus Electronema sp. V4 TaxID=3454756 RepID=UPI00405546E1